MSRAHQTDSEDLAGILSWREPVTSTRLSRAAIFSVVAHVLLFGLFWSLPQSEFKSRRNVNVMVRARRVTKLYAPKIQDLTQKAPNVGKVANELDVRSSRDTKPAPRSFRPPAPVGPANLPPSQTPAITPPDLDLKTDAPIVAGLNASPNLPRPPEAKPKFENIAPTPTGPADDAKLKMPKASISETASNAGRVAGGGGGTISSGDNGDPSAVGNMQLLSDPQNVDFKPYMQQILSLVRRQWFAVIPQVARSGRQGIVVLQFSVDRRGLIQKLVIANPSGTVAFDQAAVASVSASNPFPPLPAEYQGTEIRLQLAFSYNVPRGR